MNENPVKRREWVKNAAIVFLTIMLLLTFFSNTIMNYSLPEVATQAVMSGTITAKVRGTGTVSVSEPYNIAVSESRVIDKVSVKKGDKVKKGDVMFVLEDSESTELKEAEDALSQLIVDYEKTIIAGDTTLNAVNNIEGGKDSEAKVKQSRVEAAKNAVEAAENTVRALTDQAAVIQREIDIKGNETVDTTSEREALERAQSKLADAQIELAEKTRAKTDAEEAFAKFGYDESYVTKNYPSESAYNNSLSSAKAAMDNAKAAMSAAETDKGTAEKDFVNASKSYDTETDPVKKAELEELKNEMEAKFNDAKAALEAAETAYNEAKASYDTLNGEKDILKKAKAALDKKTEKTKEFNRANEKVEKYQIKVTEAQQALDAKTATGTEDSELTDLKNQLVDVNTQLALANTALTDAQKEQEDALKAALAEIEIGSQNEKIKKQQEVVEKLRSKAIDAKITAPVSGTVTEVNLAAGEKTTPDEAIAVVQIDGKGYSLSFSVTEEQSKKVKTGETAEIQNNWYGDEIKATLASVRPDKESGGRNKLLVFDVTGEVSEGQELSLSVGQQSSSYDLIVPNSALREDNNGKFVIIVESKSSPLGNRYIAKRVDVEVLASDDTQTAISGALYGYEYVITTSTKPVELGKQVRLADN